jgi:hypothetical protein
MVHHQDVSVEMSIHLQVAQQEIQSLRDQLRDSDVTIRGYSERFNHSAIKTSG